MDSKDPSITRMDSYIRKPPDCNPDPDSFFGDPISSPDEWFSPKEVTLDNIRETTDFDNVEDCGQSVANSMGCTIAVIYTLRGGELDIRYFHNSYMEAKYGR